MGAGSVAVSERPTLPKTVSTSRERLEDAVLALELRLRLLDRGCSGNIDGHVEEIALVEQRHELVTELHSQRDDPTRARTGRSRLSTSAGGARRRRTSARRRGSKSAPPGACAQPDVPANQEVAQRQGERDRQDREDEHHEGLRVSERLEQPRRPAREREHGQERDRDDEQREEDRRRDLFGGLGEDVIGPRPAPRAPASCAPLRS